MIASRRLAQFCVVLLVAIGLPGVVPAQAAAKPNNEITKAKTDFQAKLKAAEETLQGAFDKRINQLRSAPKLSAVEKQDAIGAIETEQAVFKKLGWIPYSPTMRSDAITYLSTLQKAESALAKVYDQAINAQTKLKADSAAKELIADKKISLGTKVVGKWNVADSNGKTLYTWALRSDGTIGKGAWTLDQNYLTKRQKDPKAPGGSWVDKASATADGRELIIKNNNGHQFRGTLSVEGP